MLKHTISIAVIGKGICIAPANRPARNSIAVRRRVRIFTDRCNKNFRERTDKP